MNEKVLHYIWKYQLFSNRSLVTSQNETIFVQKIGFHNQDSGPDFLNATIEINHQLWVGNVEIHLKSSDWYLHNHHFDENYKAVILHVVWEHDREVFNPDQQIIPTLELKSFVNNDFLNRYHEFSTKEVKWIYCENELKYITEFVRDKWLEQLFIERLELKSIVINEFLTTYKNDWEAVLFLLLCKNFGLKINSEAFIFLAESIEFQIIRKEKHKLFVLEALFFGQAGFLEDEKEDFYYKKLQKEYQFLKSKYNLCSLNKSIFHFFRLRPLNFPTVRLAQLAGVYSQTYSLFSLLMEAKNKDEIYTIFKIPTSAYWDTHYTFEKETKHQKKSISKSFIDNIIINTVIPLRFAFETQKGNECSEDLWNLIESINPEKNVIIKKFGDFGIVTKNATQSQALLQLKNEYCIKNRCLECSFGNEILNKR